MWRRILPRTSYPKGILVLCTKYAVNTQYKYDSIALYGRENFEFLKQFLDLKNGIPSHDTILVLPTYEVRVRSHRDDGRKKNRIYDDGKTRTRLHFVRSTSGKNAKE